MLPMFRNMLLRPERTNFESRGRVSGIQGYGSSGLGSLRVRALGFTSTGPVCDVADEFLSTTVEIMLKGSPFFMI